RGGMGAMSEALAQSARDLGVEIRTGAGVDKILVENGVAKGVVTEAGDEFRARVVFSSADPKRTFLGFLERDHLEDEFRRSIAAMDYSSATFKLNLALSKLPDFTALPGSTAGPQHRGTIHISPDMAFIDRAYHDALGGRPSRKPVLECTIPSVVDDSLAPEGHHTMGMFVQYAPFELADGEWDDAEKNAFATSCIDLFEEYAPGFKDSIVGIDPVSPLDLEREFGLTGGNIFHGAMTPSQLYFMRPVGECSGYATPLSGLYLCGAGSHPGGGVIGSCGRNAAREAMKRRAC
ncbi:MAG: NAD(P)/FAD-dependent oxidoreductase, partial [Planctomycetota bacterium]